MSVQWLPMDWKLDAQFKIDFRFRQNSRGTMVAPPFPKHGTSSKKNRQKSARFHDPNTDYIHPPNGREGNALENGVRQNPVGTDSTRLAWKIVHNKPGQKTVSQKKGVHRSCFKT